MNVLALIVLGFGTLLRYFPSALSCILLSHTRNPVLLSEQGIDVML
jgi:hypothetical protein